MSYIEDHFNQVKYIKGQNKVLTTSSDNNSVM